MEILVHIITPIIIAVSSFLGIQQPEEVTSVELGLIEEVSPRGQEGGFAMPASGCSYDYSDPTEEHGHADLTDCSGFPIIEIDPPIVRSGEEVDVDWNVGDHTGCEITYKDQVVNIPNGGSNTGTISGVVLTAETLFTLTCNDGSATAVGRVLPKIQET